ncbi:MAG: hypothetical protein R6V72_16420 [Cyclobacterium sp.]|nr:hypothetical protein [Cyclobacterium sp. SYSU L10401]
MEATPIALEDKVQKTSFEILPENDDQGGISLRWDKIRLEMPIRAE